MVWKKKITYPCEAILLVRVEMGDKRDKLDAEIKISFKGVHPIYLDVVSGLAGGWKGKSLMFKLGCDSYEENPKNAAQEIHGVCVGSIIAEANEGEDALLKFFSRLGFAVIDERYYRIFPGFRVIIGDVSKDIKKLVRQMKLAGVWIKDIK